MSLWKHRGGCRPKPFSTISCSQEKPSPPLKLETIRRRLQSAGARDTLALVRLKERLDELAKAQG